MTPPIGSPNPRDLWKWLQNYEDKTSGDVLAIPHNGNLSNGIMFATKNTFENGAEFDRNYVEQRAKWEKLYEIGQTKGDSETHPRLSPTDEFADYERWDWANLDLTEAKTPEMLPGEYARSALKNGLKLAEKHGVNPFKLGFVEGSHIHTGLTTNDDNNFFGAFAWMEPNAKRANMIAKKSDKLGFSYKGWQYATPGPTAVWAKENTRAGIFDALERREVYATTGPRIRVHFFGGSNFTKDDVKRRDLAAIGYTKGVPMGGEISRIKNGKPQEKIYDVSWSGGRKPSAEGKLPPVGDTVDLSIPSWTNDIGSAELGTVWTDPDFNPTLRAFYYARVIEIPTPRWTAYDRIKFKLKLPDEIKLKTQERAYTSPIWYTP